MARRLIPAAPALALLVAATTHAFAEAGSTGGSIGRQNKSISGGEDAQPAPRQPSEEQRRRAAPRKSGEQGRTTAKPAGAAQVAGTWQWDAACGASSWRGNFVLREISSTQIAGEFGGGHIGSLQGTATGGRVSFVRTFFGMQQEWTGSLSRESGSKMKLQGPFTDAFHKGCQFTATKD
jgi:hypothetical protein